MTELLRRKWLVNRGINWASKSLRESGSFWKMIDLTSSLNGVSRFLSWQTLSGIVQWNSLDCFTVHSSSYSTLHRHRSWSDVVKAAKKEMKTAKTTICYVFVSVLCFRISKLPLRARARVVLFPWRYSGSCLEP